MPSNASTVRHWPERVRARRETLPLYFGLAEPVEQTKLLAMATKIGVGDSVRASSGHTNWIFRLGAPGGYDPTRLLQREGAALADPASIEEGVHPFTFNQVRQAEEWRKSLLRQPTPHHVN